MKRVLSIFIVFILVLSTAYAEDEFLSVNDNASIISAGVQRYITTQNKALSDKTEARIIIVTDKSTGELSVKEYAQKVYDDLGVGSIGRKNCVFIFICDALKDYDLIVSDGISAAFTASDAQKILAEHMEEDFEKESYDDAVIKTYNAIANWYMDKYNVNLKLTEDMQDYNDIIETEKKEKTLKTTIIVILTVGGVVGLLYLTAHIRRKKRMIKLRKKRQERRKKYMQIK